MTIPTQDAVIDKLKKYWAKEKWWFILTVVLGIIAGVATASGDREGFLGTPLSLFVGITRAITFVALLRFIVWPIIRAPIVAFREMRKENTPPKSSDKT